MNRNTFSIIDFLVAQTPFKIIVLSLESNKAKRFIDYPGTTAMTREYLDE